MVVGESFPFVFSCLIVINVGRGKELFRKRGNVVLPPRPQQQRQNNMNLLVPSLKIEFGCYLIVLAPDGA